MKSLARPEPLRVALYARVSTEDQADRGTIQAQLALLRNLAQAYGWEVIGEYVDDGFSGTLPLDQRPDGRRLLEDARNGRFSAVIAYRLDRLGRSLRALLDAHDALERAGVTIRSATEPFDTSTPIGTFLFQLLASLAELERSTMQERMTMGRDRVARDGKWTGGPIPFGYDVDADGYLVPSQRMVEVLGITEAELVREIFQRVADGSTTIAEAARLVALGVPRQRRYLSGRVVTSNTPWDPNRIWETLKNPLYAGTHVLNSKHGPVARQVPALVSRDLIERLDQRLTSNRRLARRNATHRYLLRGLIRCENCGAGYSGASSLRDKHVGHYYRCTSTLTSNRVDPAHRCRSKMLSARWIEDLVWQDCRAFIRNPGKALAEAQRELRNRLAQTSGLDEQRRALLKQVGEKEMERERVMTLFRRGRVTLDEVERQLDDVGRETAQLRQLLEALKVQEDLAQAFEAHLSEASTMLARLGERLEEVERKDDWAAKRQIVELLVAQISVRTEGEGRKKEAAISIRYSFGNPRSAVHSGTPGVGRSRSWPGGSGLSRRTCAATT